MKRVIITSMARWVYDDFVGGLGTQKNDPNLIVNHDLGLDVPSDISDVYAWWMPAAHAARVSHAFPGQLTLTAPGATWLDDVPQSLTGRTVATHTLADTLSHPWDGKLWTKPAEAKIEGFEAQLRTFEEFVNDTDTLPDGTMVQTNDRFLSLNHEHRFYMVNGQPATGSPYLDNGVVWNDGIDWIHYEDALDFATHAGQLLGSHQPRSYILDVAWDFENNTWVVLEGNPTWCSGFYGSDIPSVLEAIHLSMIPDRRWSWTPDPYLSQMAERKRPLAKV